MGVQIQGDTGNVIATKGTFSGDVGIAGTLTYEDVTNIDSVGLVTARNGIEIGARPGVAASISVDGNMIVSGITTFGGAVNFSSTSGNVITAGKLGIGFTDNNIKVGSTALDSLTTGTKNVAVGDAVLTANTTGEGNTGVGHNVLDANTTGTGNAAVGDRALTANTTGNQNTAVGQFALNANTTAANNTAVGYNALVVNTTGTQNVSVGAYALDAKTTANY